MIFKKNRYPKHFIALVILASCSTTSKNLNLDSVELIEEDNSKDFSQIQSYQSFFDNDLETIQAAIDSQMLDKRQLNNAKILKKNYQKILKKKKYSLRLQPNNKYSAELIELTYRLNLPINIIWDEKKQFLLTKNLLSQKINGFCSSIYTDAIESIHEEINKNSDSILILYSDEYELFANSLKQEKTKFITRRYNSNNSQEFAAEILGISSSNKRFKNISSLSPNQNLNFTPRPRSDFKQIVILLNPEEYRSVIPALRYHGGNRFKYLNFISSLEEISTPLQLLDYEDVFVPISSYLTSNMQKDSSISLERFLEQAALHEWLLVQILKQAGVQSAVINGETGSIFYQSNSCTKRKIPLQKISTDLFSF